GGNEPLPLLARRFGDQLLGPEAEVAGRVGDADLVAPFLPAGAEPAAELVARVVLLAAAPLRHRLRAREQAIDLDADQRGRHDPECREGRVAAADRRLAVE